MHENSETFATIFKEKGRKNPKAAERLKKKEAT